jgi:hypothetical protein
MARGAFNQRSPLPERVIVAGLEGQLPDGGPHPRRRVGVRPTSWSFTQYAGRNLARSFLTPTCAPTAYTRSVPAGAPGINAIPARSAREWHTRSRPRARLAPIESTRRAAFEPELPGHVLSRLGLRRPPTVPLGTPSASQGVLAAIDTSVSPRIPGAIEDVLS